MEDAYAKTSEEVLKNFSVSESLGLSQEDVKRSRQKYGPNGEYCILCVWYVNVYASVCIDDLKELIFCKIGFNYELSFYYVLYIFKLPS